ncbi:MAG: type IV pilus modification protein PilV [Gammaproteobacteria bacterium]|nr:type IV pilus modification protein PilV [Gammaproteobacteria bacterium]MDH5275281.1 type IV pilus modification protein PilV [Gammaproteobacteria bacterium]
MQPGTSRDYGQGGFTLIEVLIAILVISVGLLATASLQLLSKRSNYDAAQRTTAAHLAGDLLERMRSNPAALINYIPDGPLGGNTLGAPATDCEGAGADCTAAELAAFDLWQWEQALDGANETQDGASAGGLISAQACITGAPFGGNGIYTVAIAWRGMTDSTNPATNSCGEGSGLFGDGDEFRRVLVVNSFINAG